MANVQDMKDAKKESVLVVPFGKMGSGKSHVGLRLARSLNWAFFEGDSARAWYSHVLPFLTKDNTSCCNRYVSVEHFIWAHLVPAITQQLYQHKRVVAAQALYFADHRAQIAAHFAKLGVKVVFVHVSTPEPQRAQQLKSRTCGAFWNWYSNVNDAYFEPPTDKNPTPGPCIITHVNDQAASIDALKSSLNKLL